MSEEIKALDLDWDLIQHLALPDSINLFRAEGLTAELIEDPLAESVFTWQMQHVREYKKPATASVLEDQFEDIVIDAPLTTAGDLLIRLRERYMRNQGRDAIKSIGEAYKADPLTAPRAMLQKGRELGNLVLKRGEQFGTGDYQRAMAEYDQRVLRGRGPSLGWTELDDHFYGQLGLTFLIGAPKTYKSWITINSLIENVMEGRSCVLYSLELPAAESDARIRCMAAGIPYWRYLKGSMSREDREAWRTASEELDSLGVYRVIKPERGERGAEAMIERARDAGADCIYIDQLQYTENSKGISLGERNEPGDYWGVCDILRDKSDDGPIFIAHQFNRSVMNADKMPEVQQAKGSAAIEETATLALGLWANKDMRRSNVLEVGTLISRNYGHLAWEIGVNLTKGCSFDMLGVAPDEE